MTCDWWRVDPALLRQGGEPVTSTAAEFLALIEAEYRRFGEAIRIAKLKVE